MRRLYRNNMLTTNPSTKFQHVFSGLTVGGKIVCKNSLVEWNAIYLFFGVL